MNRRSAALALLALVVAAGSAHAQVRAQLDTVGFATRWSDMQTVVEACRASTIVPPEAPPAVAVILPHDDYLYAGRTTACALPYLQAKRWIVLGVCHACRRIGVRDQLLFDANQSWRVAGRDFAVDQDLRAALQERLTPWAATSDERHGAEHSIESLLPWIGAAVDEPRFVPVLVSGMEPESLLEAAGAMARALGDLCRERGWQPGKDVGLVISADAVHYGCEGWGGGGYAPFGCDEAGHAAGRAQDVTLAEATLAGPLSDDGIADFVRLVWNPGHARDPLHPYRITWCGIYTIPFGLTVAARWRDGLEGTLLRYGDSVTDGKLAVSGTRLGVTAPSTLEHWVGYATVVYVAAPGAGCR